MTSQLAAKRLELLRETVPGLARVAMLWNPDTIRGNEFEGLAAAAQALGLSLPRYYQLEAAALRCLVEACEPQPRGRARSAEVELVRLQRELQRLQRELARQQGLVRLTQRAVGLPPPAPPPASKAKGRKPRRPVARALRAAARLQEPQADGAADALADRDGHP